jgi:hypothetical protein
MGARVPVDAADEVVLVLVLLTTTLAVELLLELVLLVEPELEVLLLELEIEMEVELEALLLELDIDVAALVPEVQVGTTLAPVGLSFKLSFALTQPDFAVNAAGHATCVNETVGLSAPMNQSKRQ